MNLSKLYKILADCTVQIRKGEIVTQETGVTTINMMPSAGEVREGLVHVDLEFLIVGVDAAKAEFYRPDIIVLLNSYPQPKRLAGGPSYIEVGGVIGSQGAAFQLFALGQVLNLWKVITPASLGLKGAEARRMAGAGFIMTDGYKPMFTCPTCGATSTRSFASGAAPLCVRAECKLSDLTGENE